jgi:hypothetical protein
VSKVETPKVEAAKAESAPGQVSEQAPKIEAPKVEIAPVADAPKEVVADKPAQVRLAIKPWGEVIVNGVSKGVSPPTKSFTLPTGEYSVEIRNGDYPAHKISIKLSAGEVFKLNHAFVDTVQK